MMMVAAPNFASLRLFQLLVVICCSLVVTARSGYDQLSQRVKRTAHRKSNAASFAPPTNVASVVVTADAATALQQTERDPHYDDVVGSALGVWYHVLDRNGDFRLSSEELSHPETTPLVPVEAGRLLAQFEQNARDFERGLCQDIDADVHTVFADHHNPRDDWRDMKELELRRTQLQDKVGCTTTPTVLDRAFEHIHGKQILIKPKWSIRTSIIENGQRANLLIPIIRHMGQLYNALHFHSLRDLIILLLERGVDINTATPNVHNAVPVVFSLLGSFHLDYFLNRAVLRSRPLVDPVFNRRDYQEGFSMPHFLAERTIAVVTKHVIQTGDHMAFANKTFAEAVKDLAANPDGLGSEWRGDLYKTEFLSLYNVSEQYRDIVHRFDTAGPEKQLSLAEAAGVGDELFRQLLHDLIEYTNWQFTEVSIRLPMVYFNVLHIMVLNRYPKSLKFFLEAYRKRMASMPVMNRLAMKIPIKTALVQQDGTGRSPVHQAALLFGADHSITQELIRMEVEVTGSNSRLQTFKDGLGNTVFDYLNKTAHFETAKNIVKSGPQAKELATLAAAREESVAALKMAESPPFQPLPATSDGGWKRYGRRTDLETKPPSKCDITEFSGMPTLAELKVFLETNEPVVFRGAGKDLKMPKQLWAHDNFLRRFHNATALVAKIPYTHQTDSPYKEPTSTKMKVDDFIRSFPVVDPNDVEPNQTSPLYLFASDFYLRNPLLLENMTAPFDVMRKITDTTLHQGGPSTDWAGLERNAQMYVGAPGSGAPMHYHQIAVNYLAYGTKRWGMLPPSSSYYSMEPSLSYFTGDGYKRDREQLLECTQHADDLFLVPDSWGHVTLNVEATIGVAYEFEYRAWMVRIPEMLPTAVFKDRDEAIYRGWTVDSADPWNRHWLKTLEAYATEQQRKSVD